MEKEKTYRAILRDVTQIVVGEFVEETDSTITLRRPAILHVSPQQGSLNLRFVPLELVSFNPPVSVRSLLTEEAAQEDIEVTLDKSTVLVSDLELKDDIFDGYEQSLNPSQVVTPPNAGGLVGPDGSPLDEDAPVAQDLF